MSKIDKSTVTVDSWLPGAGEREDWRVTANAYRTFLFQSDKKVLELGNSDDCTTL